MREVIEFALLGLGSAAVYNLLGAGIVLIYRGSGVVNFAHGVFALAGAITFVEMNTSGVPTVWSILGAIVMCAVLGVLFQNIVLARLRRAAPITRIIATLGIFIAGESGAALHYGAVPVLINQYLPQHAWVVDGVSVQSDRLILYGIAVALTIGLIILQKFSLVGLATRASAENDVAVAALAWSPNRLATANWALGGALAGLAGAFVVPLTGLILANIALLIVPAFAAALLARFDSLRVALLGATGIGVAQTLIARYWTQPGAGDALPFLVIIVVLVVTGRALPLRSHVYERLPSLGSGAIRIIPLVLGIMLMLSLVALVFNVTWSDAFTVSASESILLLSVLVVTGYAGQISLAQVTLAGLGALVAGRLVAAQGWPYWAAFLAGIAASVPIGVAFAIPALRTRGVNLAVVTLGLAAAVNSLIFTNVQYTGGLQGTTVGRLRLFGINLDDVNHPQRFGVFVMIVLALAIIVVINLRRSSHGRRLIAIRENERAAASLGIWVTGAKLYAFTIGAVLASIAGLVIGFRDTSVVYTTFDPFTSVFALAYTVIGGVGYIAGPLLGSTLAPGGVGSLFNALIPGLNNWLGVIGGASVVLILIANPDGLVAGNLLAFRRAGARLRRVREHVPVGLRRATTRLGAPMQGREKSGVLSSEPETRRRGPAAALSIDGLTVRFGQVVAVNNVSLEVKPGEIVGLIGPNGAGKTTLIDAATGFVRASAGTQRLGDRNLARLAPHQRARAGLARSWQSLELLEDVTVLDNLRVASEMAHRRWWYALSSLVWSHTNPLNATASAAVREFQLVDDLARKPGELPYGKRRLLGIARAVALNPTIICLDEPAAGLSGPESRELSEIIVRLAETWGIGVLLIEHDVELVMSVCHRIAVLDFGNKIAEGTPSEIRADAAVRAAYLGTTDTVTDATPSMFVPASAEKDA